MRMEHSRTLNETIDPPYQTRLKQKKNSIAAGDYFNAIDNIYLPKPKIRLREFKKSESKPKVVNKATTSSELIRLKRHRTSEKGYYRPGAKGK